MGGQLRLEGLGPVEEVHCSDSPGMLAKRRDWGPKSCQAELTLVLWDGARLTTARSSTSCGRRCRPRSSLR